MDIDGNPINDAWERASMDSIMMESLEEMASMLGSVVMSYTKSIEKQLNALKRF